VLRCGISSFAAGAGEVYLESGAEDLENGVHIGFFLVGFLTGEFSELLVKSGDS